MSYQKHFLESERLSSKLGKKAKIIDPLHFNTFMKKLENDESIPLWFRAFVALGVSLGSRVSETLSIKKNQVSDSGAVNNIKVLKKRRDGVVRDGKLHPTAHRIVARYAKCRRPHEYLFRGVSRQQINRLVRRYFDSDTHALCRHSHISFLVSRGKEALVIGRLLKLSSISVVFRYTHVLAEREMDSAYADAA